MVEPVRKLKSDRNSGLTVWDLLDTLVEGRWLVAGTTALFAAVGFAYAMLATPWYKAEVVLIEADKQTLPGSLGQLGGLASLAGVNLASSGDQEPLAVLRSKGYAREFILREGLTNLLLEELDPEPKKTRDIRDAVRSFDRLRSVTEDIKTGVLTLSIRWKDPVVAAKWANEYVRGVNDRLRNEAVFEAERNIVFLQKEIAATSVLSLQTAMGRVLEGEMQKLMLARGNDEFSFKVVDPATPPKLPDSPKRVLVVVATTVAGVLFSFLLLFARVAILDRRKMAMADSGKVHASAG
jgi:uncharacterized protein involved in exopolysaccharide biosynthesis